MSDSLHRLARRASELIDHFPDSGPGYAELRAGMARLAATAAADPEAALVRLRKTLQFVVDSAYERQFHEPPGTRPLENLLQRLSKEEHLPRRLAAFANLVKDLGNVGAHAFGEGVTREDVERGLEQLLPILEWHARAAPGNISEAEAPRKEAAGPADWPAAARRGTAGAKKGVQASARLGSRGCSMTFVVALSLFLAAGLLSVFRRPYPSSTKPHYDSPIIPEVSEQESASVASTVGLAGSPQGQGPLLAASALWARTDRWMWPREDWWFLHMPSSSAARSILPDWAASLPAAPALRRVYGGDPPGSSEGRVAFQQELLYRPKSAAAWHALKDGANLSSDDLYRLNLTPQQQGYLYVFQVDSSGKLTVLFPALTGCAYAEGANPVQAGEEVRIPARDDLVLDEHLGVEHLYTAFTLERWPALEADLQSCETKGAAGGGGQAVQMPLLLALRGVGGKVPHDAEAGEGVAEPPVARRGRAFAVERARGLVVERWFHHVAPGG